MKTNKTECERAAHKIAKSRLPLTAFKNVLFVLRIAVIAFRVVSLN